MENRVLSIITCLTLCLCLLPALTQTVSAAEEISYIERQWDTENKVVVSDAKKVTNCIELTSETTSWTEGNTYVAKDNITISDRISVTGNVSLILTDGCVLNAACGITVNSGNILTIYAQNGGSGKLNATASGNYGYAAGIGGERGESCGTVIIHGGVVSASADKDNYNDCSGAGIGGGSCNDRVDAGDGGTVTIYHGTVTATGASGDYLVDGGAGIGGGGGRAGRAYGGKGAEVNIYGGVVTAVGSDGGAGIGGGGGGLFGNNPDEYGGVGGVVKILGGTVYASSGGGYSDGRAIGGGYASANSVRPEISNSIIYENGDGKVHGTVTLAEDHTVSAEMKLRMGSNATLTIPNGVTLTVEGDLINEGSITNNGTLALQTKDKLTGSGMVTGGTNQIITPSADKISVPTGMVYNGTDQTIAARDQISLGGSENVTICGATFAYDTNWTLDSISPAQVKDAGTYTVTYKNGDNTLSKTFTVAKAEIKDVVPPVAATGLIYDRTAKTLLTAPASGTVYSGDTVTVTYRLGSSGNYAAEVPTATNAGSYTVYYKLNAGNNYHEVSNNVPVEIKKKEVALQWSSLAAEELVYNGTDKVLTATVDPSYLAEGDTCTVTVEASGDTKNVTNGGFFYQAVSLGNGNYVLPTDVNSPTYQITPKPLTLRALPQSIYVGTALPETVEQNVHYTIEGLVEGDSLGVVSMTYQQDGQTVTPNTGTIGTYDIIPVITEENPNYDITVESAVLTISRRPFSGDSSTPIYTPTVYDTNGGDTTVSDKYPEKGDKVTITTDPDKGYEAGKITVTDKKGKPVEVIDNGDGTFTYVQPAGKVTIEVEYVPAVSGFTDVAEESYYYNAVNWAAANGITSGTSATAFSPDNSCTRAQMATFLWRAAGSPEPKGNSNPFMDVTADAYYAKAVQWAVEQGITAGTSATTFSPNAACTRAQMATFIYRCEQANGGGFTGAWMFLLPFTDAPEWAYEPIAWCYKEGITSGTSATTFSPNDPCTRAQMVTFLYRFFVE